MYNEHNGDINAQTGKDIERGIRVSGREMERDKKTYIYYVRMKKH